MAEPILTDSSLAVRRWLLEHSGRPSLATQCDQHPPLRRMTFPQIRQILQEELGTTISRQWFYELCDRLGIQRRHTTALPAPTKREQRERQRQYQRDWYKRMREDPERRAAFQQYQRDYKERGRQVQTNGKDQVA